jgi:hypothetical protein
MPDHAVRSLSRRRDAPLGVTFPRSQISADLGEVLEPRLALKVREGCPAVLARYLGAAIRARGRDGRAEARLRAKGSAARGRHLRPSRAPHARWLVGSGRSAGCAVTNVCSHERIAERPPWGPDFDVVALSGERLARSVRFRIASFRRNARRETATPSIDPIAPEALDQLFSSIGVDRDYAGLDLEGLVAHDDPQGEPDSEVFELLIDTVRPRIVIEVGTWTGGSLLQMFEQSRTLGCHTRFIAVDTWLGSKR